MTKKYQEKNKFKTLNQTKLLKDKIQLENKYFQCQFGIKTITELPENRN